MREKISKSINVILTIAALSGASITQAEDTDIFTVNPNISSQRPNVLIIVDNTANWNTVFDAEKTALVSTFTGLTDQFNVGIEFFTNANDKETTAVSSSSINKGAYIRAAIRQMTSGNRTKYADLINALTSATGAGGDGGDAPFFGLAMAEAYYYFKGTTQYAGAGYRLRDYLNNPNNTSGNTTNSVVHALTGSAFATSSSTTYISPNNVDCQKNFIIFISNGQSNLNENSGNTVKTLLANAGGNTTTIGLDSSVNHFEGSYADEWARFMANTTVSSHAGSYVYTYTVDVSPSSTGNGPDNTALLKSMASVGKGKYYTTNGNASDIADALNKIFTEILSVNSVFASASLPASGNVRGTYLNQVYMGVFRPDGNANPRWPGNLKEYKLGLSGSNGLEIQDKNGASAANTVDGFFLPTITSFWTTSSTTLNGTTTGQFWNTSFYTDMATSSGGAADAPDGDLVEKGGAAQKLRNSLASSQTARNLYTCSGSCTTNSQLSNSPFSSSNTDITDALLGLNNTISISSLTHSGNTATAIAAAHGLSTGSIVTISGANQSEYNLTAGVTVVDSNTFTYSITESPTTPATTASSMSVTKPTAGVSVTSITRSGTTATVTTSGNHGFTNGSTVTISGASQSAYNGSYIISTAGGNTFTYTVIENPVAASYSPSGATALVSSVGTKSISTISRSNLVVTVNTSGSPHGFTTGQSVSIGGFTGNYTGYNGTFTIQSVPTNKSFTYNLASTSPASPASGTISAASTATVFTISSITRSGTTATATTSAAHGYSVGNSIVISGANEAAYNGTATILSVPTTTTFTYAVTISPASPATGSITAQSSAGVTSANLINWVRGQNVLMTDNPTDNTNSTNTHIRGYVHGDVVHSRPVVINYNRNGLDNGTDVVVFYGSNDGIFHAIKGGTTDTDGTEKWGFVPQELFSKLLRLYQNTPIISTSASKPYFLDGPIGIYKKDVNGDGKYVASDGDKVYLYLTARRGGRFVYALDVSDPDTPKMLWKISSSTTGFSELGYTWSEPKPVTIKASSDPVLIFGAGYDPTAEDADTQGTATMGRGIYIVNALTGSLIKKITTAEDNTLAYPVPGDTVPLDIDSDGYVDRVYFADTGGHVWRLNLDSATISDWVLKKLASIAGSSSSDKRKFLYSPDVIKYTSYHAVLIGSGDREHPFETTVTNRFYMFKDNTGTNATPPDPDNANDGINEADLCDVSNYYSNTITINTCLANTSKYGWYYTLGTGEKVTGTSTSLNETVYFGTNIPSSVVNTAGYCGSDLGEARIYALDARNASSTTDINGDGVIDAGDAYTTYPGGGLPPSPVPVIVEVPDGNGGTVLKEGVITGPSALVPPGLSYNQRYRSYWYFEGDN